MRRFQSRPSWMRLYFDLLECEAAAAFTTEQVGALVLLLRHAWASEDGTIPGDDEKLARLTRLGADWPKHRDEIRACFEEAPDAPGRIFHRRLLEDREKYEREWLQRHDAWESSRRRRADRKAAPASSDPASHPTSHPSLSLTYQAAQATAHAAAQAAAQERESGLSSPESGTGTDIEEDAEEAWRRAEAMLPEKQKRIENAHAYIVQCRREHAHPRECFSWYAAWETKRQREEQARQTTARLEAMPEQAPGQGVAVALERVRTKVGCQVMFRDKRWTIEPDALVDPGGGKPIPLGSLALLELSRLAREAQPDADEAEAT